MYPNRILVFIDRVQCPINLRLGNDSTYKVVKKMNRSI